MHDLVGTNNLWPSVA